MIANYSTTSSPTSFNLSNFLISLSTPPLSCSPSLKLNFVPLYSPPTYTLYAYRYITDYSPHSNPIFFSITFYSHISITIRFVSIVSFRFGSRLIMMIIAFVFVHAMLFILIISLLFVNWSISPFINHSFLTSLSTTQSANPSPSPAPTRTNAPFTYISSPAFTTITSTILNSANA